MKTALPPAFGPSTLDPHATLQEALRHRLCTLPYPAYTRLVRGLLMESGYAGVRGMKSGLAPHAPGPGGYDLVAFFHTDLSTHLTAIQIKQSPRPVGRRYVDELRGAMLRLGAEQGLLVTTGNFSKAACEAAALSRCLTVRLLEGPELVAMLLGRGEGVRIERLPRKPGDEVEWGLDEEFFTRLEAAVACTAVSPRPVKVAP